MTALRYQFQFVAFAVLFAALTGAVASGPRVLPIAEVVITCGTSLHVFRVEVATRPTDLQRGLQNWTTLPADGGMLLLADKPQTLDLWMKDTLIPLDMLFFDTGGAILAIRRQAKPCSENRIPSPGPVAGVFELAGGTASRLAIRTGERIAYR